jgi:hypothetical protein
MVLNFSVIFVETSWKRMKQVTTSMLLFIQLHLESAVDGGRQQVHGSLHT